MPDPFERHGRPGSWDWDSGGPSRHDLDQAAISDSVDGTTPPEHAGRSRRQPRDQCKRNKNGPHSLELRVSRWAAQRYSCHWVESWSRASDGKYHATWSCHHESYCTRCGKIVTTSIPTNECPTYPGSQEERDQVETKAAAKKTVTRRFRPLIMGRTSYRKPKAAKRDS